MPRALHPVLDRETLRNIKVYKNRVKALQITLHMSAQKATLVLAAKKLDEVPRLRTIQDEMDEAVVMVEALYNKIDSLVKAFQREEGGEPEVKEEEGGEEKVEIKNEVKMEDA